MTEMALRKQLPQQTRKWIQAIGGDVEFSNNWNAGTGGYRRLGGTFASGSFYEGLNNTTMYVASPGPAILSATNGQPMYCGRAQVAPLPISQIACQPISERKI